MSNPAKRRALVRAVLVAAVLLVVAAAIVAACAPPPITCDRWHVAVWVRVQAAWHPVCAPDSNADGWPDRAWTTHVGSDNWAWDAPTPREEHP
jgi:hypothetical protein